MIASDIDANDLGLWDVHTGQRLKTLGRHICSATYVAWSPVAQTVASSSVVDNGPVLWDVETGASQRLDGCGTAYGLVWSPDGRLLASGSQDGAVLLWDVESGKLRNVLKGHSGFVISLAWSPDGRLLASGSSDKTVRLWNKETGALLRTLRGHTNTVRSLSFSSDLLLLASKCDDGLVRLWRCRDWHLRAVLIEPVYSGLPARRFIHTCPF